jgi:hypothetical protein
MKFEETVENAAQAVYARTKTAGKVQWGLLPRNVQDEIRSLARTAITVALVDLRESIREDMEKQK